MKHSSSNGCLSWWHNVTFPGLTRCPKLVILLEIRVYLWHKVWCAVHREIKYAIRSSSKHSYTSYEMLWIIQAAMDTPHYNTASHFLDWYGVRMIWLFCMKLECLFSRKDTVLPIRGSDVLPGALPILFIHPRKVTKHSSSNGCLSLSHMATFPGLFWCPKLVSFL